MRKKAKRERQAQRKSLDVQMNVGLDVYHRNPRIKALQEEYSGQDYDEAYCDEVNRILIEVCGEVFPFSGFPVLREDGLEESESELVLSIDLNFTKNEIMFAAEQFVASSLNEYRKNRTLKHQRKHPEKWQDYLEIWDLKDGYHPWIDLGDGIKAPSWRKMKRPLTYEEIAKFKVPNALSPEELSNAISKVKQQYRAAYKLVCGERYDAEEILRQIPATEVENLCDQCMDRHCEKMGELCPAMLRELAKVEKRSLRERLAGNLQGPDIERLPQDGDPSYEDELIEYLNGDKGKLSDN